MADIKKIKVGDTTYDIKDSTKLPKVTYEWNKEFAAGSNGAISLGRYNIYDSQLTFDITSTTSQSLSGKLVIATQNGTIKQAKVFGDVSGALVSKLIIYQSAISNNRSWVEVFCNFNGWSKNKVHIYAVALNSATVEKQMTSVTISNGVPAAANVTSGDTKWTGTILNGSSHSHDVSIATSSGTNELTLAHGTKYALTAGGQSFIFTMPSDNNTHNSHAIISGTKSDGSTQIKGSASSGDITLGDSGVTAGAYGDTTAQTPGYNATFKVPSISVNAKGIVTAIGEHTVKIPASDNSDTHYTNYLQIKGNGTEAIKFTQNADKSLNLKPGNNVSISAAANEITIGATVPTKSSWNYDDTYVKYSAAQSLTDAQKTQARSNIGAGTSNLTIGTTASTAAAGNHTHSNYTNQNAFSNIKVAKSGGGTSDVTVAADTTTDTVTFEGSNVTITGDATNDKVTIGITKANVTAALGYTPPTTDNNTTYTFATGDANGQIKVTPSGGSAQNISVKGLGSAAYTNSSAYAAASHGTHVTADTVKSALGTGTGTSKYLREDGTWVTPPNTTYPTAKTFETGVARVFNWYNTSATYAGGNIPTSPDSTNTRSVNSITSTAGRYYGVEADLDGRLFVNVPWTNVNSSYLTSHQTIKQDGVTGAIANHYGECSTDAETAAKTVSITAGTFNLEAGARIIVWIKNANSANTPTLNVNNKGAKNIFYRGTKITSGAEKGMLYGTCEFIYDGTQFHLVTPFIIPTTIGAAPTSHSHMYAGSSSAGGAANSVKTSLTFNNGGAGAASGTTYNGSTARTISYNTIGAAPTEHNHFKSLGTYSEIGALKYDITEGNITTTASWIAGSISSVNCFGHVAKTGTNTYILFLWIGDNLYRSTYDGSSWVDDTRTYAQANKLPTFSLSGTVLTITDNN